MFDEKYTSYRAKLRKKNVFKWSNIEASFSKSDQV